MNKRHAEPIVYVHTHDSRIVMLKLYFMKSFHLIFWWDIYTSSDSSDTRISRVLYLLTYSRRKILYIHTASYDIRVVDLSSLALLIGHTYIQVLRTSHPPNKYIQKNNSLRIIRIHYFSINHRFFSDLLVVLFQIILM